MPSPRCNINNNNNIKGNNGSRSGSNSPPLLGSMKMITTCMSNIVTNSHNHNNNHNNSSGSSSSSNNNNNTNSGTHSSCNNAMGIKKGLCTPRKGNTRNSSTGTVLLSSSSSSSSLAAAAAAASAASAYTSSHKSTASSSSSSSSSSFYLLRLYARNQHIAFLWMMLIVPAFLWTMQWNHYNHYYYEQQQVEQSQSQSQSQSQAQSYPLPIQNQLRRQTTTSISAFTSTRLINSLNLPSTVLVPFDNSPTTTRKQQQQQQQQRKGVGVVLTNREEEEEEEKKEDRLDDYDQDEEDMDGNGDDVDDSSASSTPLSTKFKATKPKNTTVATLALKKQQPKTTTKLTIPSFDPTKNPILPPNLFVPNSSNPLQVIYAGGAVLHSSPDDEKNDAYDSIPLSSSSLILDGLSRSKYILPIGGYFYHSQRLAQKVGGDKKRIPYRSEYIEEIIWNNNSINNKNPQNSINHNDNKDDPGMIVLVVDWSGIQKDCHILRQILNRIEQRYFSSSMVRPAEQPPPQQLLRLRLVLIDESTSPRIIGYNTDNSCIISRNYNNQDGGSGNEDEDDDFLNRIMKMSSSSSSSSSSSNDNNNGPFIVVKRSIVEGRYWNSTKEWIEPGHLVVERKETYSISATTTTTASIPPSPQILQLPLMLSQLWISSLHSEVKRKFDKIGSTKNKKKLLDYTDAVVGTSDNDNKNRLYDITVLYNGRTSHYSSLRKKVTSVMKQLSKDTKEAIQISYLQIHPNQADPTQLINQYLSSKIVLIAQSDDWEGDDVYADDSNNNSNNNNDNLSTKGSHLLEAMSCGALVFTDDMVSSNYVGLRNKTNIVLYDSTESLLSLIRFYLFVQIDKRTVIARHGLEWALGRHRTYHSMETILFGKPITRTDKCWEDSSPPHHDVLKNNMNDDDE